MTSSWCEQFFWSGQIRKKSSKIKSSVFQFSLYRVEKIENLKLGTARYKEDHDLFGQVIMIIK